MIHEAASLTTRPPGPVPGHFQNQHFVPFRLAIAGPRRFGRCSMARVPTMAEEDAKRANRERECLVGERTRIVNRMKATLARQTRRHTI